MEYGLIGEKLGHSFSKRIHAQIGSYDYELKELSREALGEFLTECRFSGINVTIPYKKDVIPYLTHISEGAKKIGAVNTVVNRGGELWGYNTDIIGLVKLIRRVLARSGRENLSGLKVLILGTGGTSLTAQAAAEELNAKIVLRVSRSARDGAISYGEAKAGHTDAGFVINCTPSGMFPDNEGMPLSLNGFSGLVGVVDAVYNPLRTRFVRAALAAGIPAEGGLYMLVAQAVAAYELFFDTKAGTDLTDSIYADILSEKENLVLIGMPSSGKTTVGKLLAKKLGRSFFDTDEEIVKAEKMPITAIFSEKGEPCFREIESRVIAELSSGTNGAVIATGGGAVLNAENIDRLRANGRIYYLDRPLALLMPTPDRPVASSPEAIRQRYKERKPLYEARCDVRIDASKTPKRVAQAILDEMSEKNRG